MVAALPPANETHESTAERAVKLARIERHGVQTRWRLTLRRTEPPAHIRLATSSSITSVAPPPIACTRASRAMRSITLSRM